MKKNKLTILQFLLITFIVILIINKNFAQSVSENWMFQTAGFVIEGYTTNNPNDYSWNELSNIAQGVHISILPAEKVPIYIELNNNYICFNTFTSPAGAFNFIVSVDVNVNESGFYNIYNGNATMSVVWFNSSNVFSSIGSYNLEVSITDEFYNIKHREYEIKVIKSSDKLFEDNYGNTLRLWKGNNPSIGKPIVFSEGFDAYDTNPQQMYYSAASELMSCLYDNGFDVYLLDNKYGTQDIRNNAAGLSSAIKYISSLYNNQLIIAGGVSMGGMIARYALAKAEDIGDPLPVSIFISVDSPQQGAVISQALQDYKKEKQTGDAFAEHALNNIAAKQLLNYCTYDPDGGIHQTFYSELNSLNGDGYPHLTKNIGVSFSTSDPNPDSGTWIYIEWNSPPFQGEEASFDLSPEERVAGSYLPVDLTTTSPIVMRAFCWIWNYIIQPWNYPTVTITRTKHPAYIPYESALDIVNGNSKFDITIEPEQTTFHDVLPSEIIDPIINELVFKDLFLQNETVLSDKDFIGKNIYSGNHVNNLIPYGDFVISTGANVSLTALEEIVLSEGFSVENGANFCAKIEESMIISCNEKDIINKQSLKPDYGKIDISELDLFEKFSDIRYYNSVEKVYQLNKIEIYPNPNKGVFLVKIQNPENIELELAIHDMYGKIISKTKINNSLQEINISKNDPGIYFVTLNSKSSHYKRKIIKY